MLVVRCVEGYLEAKTKQEALENYLYMVDECEYVLVEIYDTEEDVYYSRAQLEDMVQMELALAHGCAAEAAYENSLEDREEFCRFCGTRKMKGFLCMECGRI